MRVQVKFFAIFREMTGIKNESKEIPEGMTVDQLWKRYAGEHPRIANIRAAYAVNQRLARPDQILRADDEVGFLPPVSGGAVRKKARRARARPARVKPASSSAQVTHKALDLATLIKQVSFPGAGAIITFSGVVRDNSQGKSVDHLEYEAYPEMAQRTLETILEEVQTRWPTVHAAMNHRVGKLKIGDTSLIIAIAAPHRPEAFAAARYAIERVKAVLPVWKKEFASDGDYWVEGPLAGELAPEKAEEIARDADYTPF